MLMGTFCNPAGQQQPRGSRLLSYLYEPVIEIIGLFESADVHNDDGQSSCFLDTGGSKRQNPGLGSATGGR